MDEKDKFYEHNPVHAAQLYGYVPQFKQDTRHFIKPRAKVIADPDAYNFEQFVNESRNADEGVSNPEEEEIEIKPITAFVKKSNNKANDTVVAG